MSNILTTQELNSLLNLGDVKQGLKGDMDVFDSIPEEQLSSTLNQKDTQVHQIISDAELNSITSDAKPEDIIEMKKLERVPEQVSGKFYHVVLDCDFGDFVDDTKRQNRPAVIFGKIAKKINDRIPIVYNKDDAVRIAAKLINMVVNKGSVGTGSNKKYPYLGAVIVGFQFSHEHYSNVTYEKVSVESGEGRIYDHVANNTKDLVYWEVNGVVRGTIAKQALTNTKIVDGEYITRKDINPDNGFALLNLVPSLSVDDIQTLMCMYRGEGRNCYGHGSSKEAEKVNLKIDIERKGEVQLGGKYNDFKLLATREKAKYLLNKKKETNVENLENHYREKYIEKKNEYLKLKSQKGGAVNEDNDHPTEDEAYWKPKYRQAKAQYLALKNNKNSK